MAYQSNASTKSLRESEANSKDGMVIKPSLPYYPTILAEFAEQLRLVGTQAQRTIHRAFWFLLVDQGRGLPLLTKTGKAGKEAPRAGLPNTKKSAIGPLVPSGGRILDDPRGGPRLAASTSGLSSPSTNQGRTKMASKLVPLSTNDLSTLKWDIVGKKTNHTDPPDPSDSDAQKGAQTP